METIDCRDDETGERNDYRARCDRICDSILSVRGRNALSLLRAAMRNEPGSREWIDRCDTAGFPDQSRRALPEGLDLSRIIGQSGSPVALLWCETVPRELSPRQLGGSTGSRDSGIERRAAQARPGRGGSFRRRKTDQREGLPAGKIRSRRVAHFADRLQRSVLHVLGRGCVHQGIRSGSRASLSLGGYPQARHDSSESAAISRKPCRRSCSISSAERHREAR